MPDPDFVLIIDDPFPGQQAERESILYRWFDELPDRFKPLPPIVEIKGITITSVIHPHDMMEALK